MFISSICIRPSWTLTSPWVEERGDVDVAVAPAEPLIVAHTEERVREWGRVDIQENLVLAAGHSSDGGD